MTAWRVPAWRRARDAARRAEADERLRVDDVDRDALASALHDVDCGWNCPGHGIMQDVNDQRYGRLADAALRFLARRGRLATSLRTTDDVDSTTRRSPT